MEDQAALFSIKGDLNAQGDGEIFSTVARRKPEEDGNLLISKYVENDSFHLPSLFSLNSGHLADNETPDPIEFSCLFHMGQHSVDSVGRFVEILEKQDRVSEINLVSRPDGRDEKGKASAFDPPLPHSPSQGLAGGRLSRNGKTE